MENNEVNIERYGKDAVVSSPCAVFSYQVENPRELSPRDGNQFSWNNQHFVSEDIELLPYGRRNDMPQLLRDVVYSNPNIPGVFEKKQGLLWGKGPALYQEEYVEQKDGTTRRVRKWQENKEIQAWLDSWDYCDYLLNVITDFNFMQGSFTKFIRQKGSLIGKNKFHSLEHLNPAWSRLGRKLNAEKPTHCIFSNWWMKNGSDSYKKYPLYDSKNPFGKANAVMYSRTLTFATDFYAIPTIFGSLEWIRRSTAIPLILRALSKHSINAKYHVTSPSKFWEDKKEELERKAEAENRDYDDRELQLYEKKLFRSITKTLASDENVGKIWHTKDIMIVDGMNLISQGWTIKPIDQNIKDFVETQIKIGNKADSAVSAALGIHKSLAGISGEGKADSGSEQLYAYLMYKLIGVDIPEYIVTKAINEAIKHNFNTDLKLGFYHGEAQRQQDQTSKDRIKNN
ncbi:MAG: hypothetical protein CSA38_01965 [Flavobacteriales bacterium]|nr:MAG: hypothetical protein CSA38_01965 [Flavobacteriales bacterium]